MAPRSEVPQPTPWTTTPEVEIRRQFLRAATTVFLVAIPLGIAVQVVTAAAGELSLAVWIASVLFWLAMLLVRQVARRDHGPWPALVFLGLVQALPVVLGLSAQFASDMMSVPFYFALAVVASGPLLGPAAPIASAAISGLLCFALFFARRALFDTPSRVYGAELALVRGGLVEIISAAIGVFFSRRFRSMVAAFSEAHRALEARAQADRRLSEFVRLATDGVIGFDAEGRIRVWNPALEKMTGYTAAEVTGVRGRDSPLLALPEAHEQGIERFRKVLSGEPALPWVFRFVRKDGAERWLESNSSLVVHDDGTREVYAAIRDITERRRIEERLVASQRLEALGQLAGGVAHDFNNLLTAMLGSAELLGQDPALPPKSQELLLEVQGAGERAAALTRQLLAFSRRQPLEPRSVDLDLTLAGFERLLRRVIGEDIVLRIVAGCGGARVRVDVGQAEQAILNLCVNAKAAMPKGGKLTLESRVDDLLPTDAHADGAPAGRYVHFSVKDTGHGMDAATLSHIFEPFFTTKQPGEGTGLGLAMVHGFVRQSGGRVWAESRPGEGATFHVLLPVDETAATQPAAAPAPAIPAGGRGRILVVEDDPMVARTVARILGAAGYHVTLSPEPAQALERFGPRGEDFDLVLSDVVMPVMSGPELVARLRERRADLPVLFMSGYARPQLPSAELLRSERVIEKPFTPQGLVDAVRQRLDDSRKPAGA